MADTLRIGARLFSGVCSTEMIVVKVPDGAAALTIGGAPASTTAVERHGDVVEGHGGSAAIGKRYVNEAGTLELLCTKGGDGLPAWDGELLHIRDAKPLPASD